MTIHARGMVAVAALVAALAGCEKKEHASQTETTSAEVARGEREAAEAKQAAEEATTKLHAEVRSRLQSDFDAADRKASYLKAKASKATGVVKKDADAAVVEFDRRRAAADAGLKKLDAGASGTWDSARTEAESLVESMRKGVDSLEATLK
jgi:hypothetical protein